MLVFDLLRLHCGNAIGTPTAYRMPPAGAPGNVGSEKEPSVWPPAVYKPVLPRSRCQAMG